jgi:N-acyl-D-amino-acid deacylase
MYDVLIKNGTVIDGSGNAAKKMDVAIQNGLIVDLAPEISGKANVVIDAKEMFVAPGFIDVQNHSDSYWTIFDQPDQLSLLSQGITSIVMGNCGSSLAPLLSQDSIKAIQKWHNLSGININWVSVSELLATLAKKPLGLNVATLVGYATIRRGLLRDKIRELQPSEIRVIDRIIEQGLAEGAMGLSLGLVYAHEINSTVDELKKIAVSLKPHNKYLSVHLRSEAGHILESLDEVLELADSVGVPVKISHLKIRGKEHWPLFDQMISKLEIAYHRGVKVSFDVYPYDTSWSVLYTYLPKWAYEGGRVRILENISQPMNRRKILDYLRDQNQNFQNIIVAEANGNQNFVGKSLKQIATSQEVSVEEALLNLIFATNAQIVVFDQNLSLEQVELLCASPLSFVATDGAGFNSKTSGLVHPRCFGTMPRFLKMTREKKLLKWEAAIKKITSEPANFLGVKDRGLIAKNKFADVVIFDPLTVKDNADYSNSFLLSSGINKVLVNGKVAFDGERVLELNGKIISR